MSREIEFFITEEQTTVRRWAKEKKESGAIVVGNSDLLLEYLQEHTAPNDDFSARISGAWLDQCVKWSVRSLLTPHTLAEELPQRSVSAVMVDLTTCVLFSEQWNEKTIEERRYEFLSELWRPASTDPRLTILPPIPLPTHWFPRLLRVMGLNRYKVEDRMGWECEIF